MVVVNEIFAFDNSLSEGLQSKTRDLASDLAMAEDLSVLLKDMRENAEQKFHDLFAITETIAEEIGEQIKLQRNANQHAYRDVYTPDIYYRQSVYIPFVDHFIAQLDKRLLKYKNVLAKIVNFLPYKIIDLDDSEISDSVEAVSAQWPNKIVCDSMVKKEAILWKQKWISSKLEDKPRNFLDALCLCDKIFFPNIHNILKICATIPVTTPERSFSSLRRLRSYLRNSMSENRLNDLAMLSIRWEIDINIETVIDRFA